jgi:translation initiation factor 1
MKKKLNTFGIVYSTDPNFQFETTSSEEDFTPEPSVQSISVRLETKHRAGKSVTLIEGFKGIQSDKEELIKKLKNHCGTGGSAKEGEMLIQGDQLEKVLQWLLKQGYVKAKKK